ncbi:MAG: DUF4430 domain-containing protein [Candidatus Omnitrophota bacterium]
MEKIIRIIAVAVFCIFSAVTLEARAEKQGSYVNENNKKIVMEIDYGGTQPSRTVEVSLAKGKTVLEVLQTVATVETHPVGQYVFVTSIDGVTGKRGEMAWYYTVDDKSPGELAYSKVIDGTQRVKWTYKKDVCSWKVDDKLKPPEEGGVQK